MKKIAKKVTAIAACAAMCAACGVNAGAYFVVENSAGLIINEEWMLDDQKPIIENGSTLAPLRVIGEKLGFTVGWEENERKVTLTKDDLNIIMYIDKAYYVKNGEKQSLDAAPEIFYDTTMVPVRVLAEAIGCDVEWVGNNNIVTVDSPKTYAYYSQLPTEARTYNEGDYVTLSGYVDKFQFNSIALPESTAKYSFVPDSRINCNLNSGYSYPSLENVKRIELVSVADEEIAIEPYIGKRVVLKGKLTGTPNNKYSSALLRITADSIEFE